MCKIMLFLASRTNYSLNQVTILLGFVIGKDQNYVFHESYHYKWS